jgi:hypothetical protein
MMINAAGPSSIQGNSIELWHGERLVVATVVWRKGTRAGLRSEQRVPVEDILAQGGCPSLQLTALPMRARHQMAASHDGSRLRARIIELAGVLIVAATLAASGLVMVEQAFARPLQAVQAALGN